VYTSVFRPDPCCKQPNAKRGSTRCGSSMKLLAIIVASFAAELCFLVSLQCTPVLFPLNGCQTGAPKPARWGGGVWRSTAQVAKELQIIRQAVSSTANGAPK